MSVGPLGGVLGSVAGAPLAQASGSESERVKREGAAQDQRTDVDRRAERTGGVGHTDEDQATGDRDADGRRMWEDPAGRKQEPEAQAAPRDGAPRPKDPTGAAGARLDLTG